MQNFVVGIIFCFALAIPAPAFSQSGSARESTKDGGTALDKISNTQKARSTERFDILSWIQSNKTKVAEQNRKWGGPGKAGGGPYPDLTLTFMMETSPVSREDEGSGTPTIIGTDVVQTARLQFFLDDLFTRGNKDRLLNLDLGIELYGNKLASHSPDALQLQSDRASQEYGGALLFRPFGRSSQDTGLFVKGGYFNRSTKAYWVNQLEEIKLSGYYLGAEAKIYLLPFAGIEGEYDFYRETPTTGIEGKFAGSRFRYGASLEIFLLHIGVYKSRQDTTFSPDATTVKTKESVNATGAIVSLHF